MTGSVVGSVGQSLHGGDKLSGERGGGRQRGGGQVAGTGRWWSVAETEEGLGIGGRVKKVSKFGVSQIKAPGRGFDCRFQYQG